MVSDERRVMSDEGAAAVLAGDRSWAVVQGDCLDVLAGMPDESVDMIWTDPPYGHNNADGDLLSRLHMVVADQRESPQSAILNDDQDSMRKVVDGMLTHAARVLRCCCCCCCGGGGPRPTFAWVAQRMDAGGMAFNHAVVWDKKNPSLGWRYRRQYEFVHVAHRRGGRLAWRDGQKPIPNIVSMSKPRAGLHPNEKPVELVAKFIEAHTEPGGLVVDPFCGSGTTGVACANLGRRFIGIELDEKHHATAVERVRGAFEGKLFG